MTFKSTRDYAVLNINGQRHEVKGADAFMMLADYLRYKKSLTGTKIVCAEGDCGACTVLCCKTHIKTDHKFEPINACITMVADLDGSHLITIEGIKCGNAFTAVQEAVVKYHGSQCGFCTPGFVMAVTAMFERAGKLAEQAVKNHLTGNLCRCTGYQPIIEAAMAVDNKHRESPCARYRNERAIKDLQEATADPLYVTCGAQEFFAPKTMKDALTWKALKPQTILVGGATDIGVAINKNKIGLKTAVSLSAVHELSTIYEESDRVWVGSRVTIDDVRKFTKDHSSEFSRFLNIFASPQIKHRATLIGNVANGSPIADTVPFLMVTEGRVHARSVRGARCIDIRDFYRGYKENVLDSDELITHISFKKIKKSESLRLEKVSQRKDLDISTVNCAFLFEYDKQTNVIQEARIAYGGVAATVIPLDKTERYLKNKTLCSTIINNALAIVREEISPISDLRGTMAYRYAVALGLFQRFLEELMHDPQPTS